MPPEGGTYRVGILQLAASVISLAASFLQADRPNKSYPRFAQLKWDETRRILYKKRKIFLALSHILCYNMAV